VASVTQLVNRLSEYLNPSELKKIKEAYRFSDEMHLGQVRKSGEPYISHPIAVAEICAEWKLDAQAIMAALLHDLMIIVLNHINMSHTDPFKIDMIENDLEANKMSKNIVPLFGSIFDIEKKGAKYSLVNKNWNNRN
jgi:hypothetical protein